MLTDDPEPAVVMVVVLPYPVVVPYSKYHVVARLLGFTVPLSVADAVEIPEAAVVTTVGGFWNLKEAIFVAHGHQPPKVPTYSCVVQKVVLSTGSTFMAE